MPFIQLQSFAENGPYSQHQQTTTLGEKLRRKICRSAETNERTDSRTMCHRFEELVPECERERASAKSGTETARGGQTRNRREKKLGGIASGNGNNRPFAELPVSSTI
ncbi:unnamed protein product, partial [Ixodes pacificus]